MLKQAPQLHASLLKNGFHNHTYQCNLLLQSYVQSGFLSDALSLLLHFISFPNVVSYNTLLSGLIKSHRLDEAHNLLSTSPLTDSRSWNIVISGYARERRFELAIAHFLRMRNTNVNTNLVRPDSYTYAIIVPCCDLGLGKQIHAEIVKVRGNSDAFVGTNLIRMYGEAGEVWDARKVFDETAERDLVAWNALISCYSKCGIKGLSFRLFQELLEDRIVAADEFTYASVLNDAEVFEAMQVHSLIVRYGFCSDRFTCNQLINSYSKCGYVEFAFRLFEEMMPNVDEVSWTAIISGLSQNGFEKHAIKLFSQMHLMQIELNSFTFGTLFNACATANLCENGKQLHSLALKFGVETDVIVGSAMLDMYSKCGEMDDALKIFQSMPEKDLACWNAMICGFSQNGEATKTLNLIDEMVLSTESEVTPNEVTFIGVLSACAHRGLVSEGFRYFDDMINKYSIKPKAEHYTCIVDILAGAGLLKESEALISEMPFKPDHVMLGMLLRACKLHGHTEMAKRVAGHLWEDEPENSSNYVILANMYTAINEWDNAFAVRRAMDAKGAKKMVGCSWIEIRSCVHSFVSGYTNHPEIKLLYELLHKIHIQIEDASNYGTT